MDWKLSFPEYLLVRNYLNKWTKFKFLFIF
jgi:hypothetical protein